MKASLHLSLLSLTLVLAACDATSDEAPDAGQAGRGGSGPDGGEPTSCEAPGTFTVTQAGKELEVQGVHSSAAWTTLSGREVFRLRLETRHDPIPEAVDDELALVTLIDLTSSQVLGLRDEPLAIDQHVSTPGSRTSYADAPGVEVDSGTGHATVIQRVLVEEPAFGTNPAAASYHATGELRLRMLPEHRVQGTLSLTIDGSVPLSFAGDTQTLVEGCFELTASAPAGCQPGEECGQDCLGAEEWPCGACGALYFTHECTCRPDLAPLEECDASAAPGGEGELCGEEWWCSRSCAQGLVCAPDPTYGRGDAGAGMGDSCEFYTTCQSSQ